MSIKMEVNNTRIKVGLQDSLFTVSAIIPTDTWPIQFSLIAISESLPDALQKLATDIKDCIETHG